MRVKKKIANRAYGIQESKAEFGEEKEKEEKRSRSRERGEKKEK